MHRSARLTAVAALAALTAAAGCGEGPSSPGSPAEPVPWGSPEALTEDPGRVTLHRLNNRELDRTLQELLASELSLSDTLPKDPLAGGFDNNADALTVGTLVAFADKPQLL